ITHRDLSQLARCRMLEREERLRSDAIARDRIGEAYEDHARDCASLGEYQKALHYLSLALLEQGEAGRLLHLRGLWRDRIGDKDGARDSYERAGEWSAPKFNLALLHYRAQRNDEALACVDQAIELGTDDRAYRVLRGDILDRLGRKGEARGEWQDAVDGKLDLEAMDDFTLSWLETATRRLGNEAVRERIQQQRHQFDERMKPANRQGELPARYEAVPPVDGVPS
ncbi:MAG: tetratricopeptide repeat protein, partial [Rhodanobacteraceae bacterium]